MGGFQRVQEILDLAIGGPDAGIGRHGPFWRDVTRDEFVVMKVFGKPVVSLGDGAASNLVRALKGEAPFGRDLPVPPPGATIKRMPVGFDPVPEAAIAEIERWIDDGCPQDAPAFAWRPTNAPLARRFDDIWFRDPDRGWAANSIGQILHTQDGGITWTEQFVDEEVYFRCLGFATDTRGWAGTAPAAPDKRLLETSDGGAGWTYVTDLPPLAPDLVCGMSVVGDSVVYASGTNDPLNPTRMMRTLDAGATWTAWDMGMHADLLVDNFFTDADHGWVVGGKDVVPNPERSRDKVRAVVLRTEDGGQTWTDRLAGIADQLPLGEWGWKIQFLDDQVGFVALESFTRAAILKTTDGGQSWTRIEVHDPQGNANLEGIGFVDETTGWVGGWGSASFREGFSSATTDGAATWCDANEIGRFINRFRFLDSPVTVGYASGMTVYKYSDKPVPMPLAAVAATPLFDNQPRSSGVPVRIPLVVPEGAERLSVRIWGRFGEHVRGLVDERAPVAGARSIEWDGADHAGSPVPDGSFVIRVAVDGDAEALIVHLTR